MDLLDILLDASQKGRVSFESGNTRKVVIRKLLITTDRGWETYEAGRNYSRFSNSSIV